MKEITIIDFIALSLASIPTNNLTITFQLLAFHEIKVTMLDFKEFKGEIKLIARKDEDSFVYTRIPFDSLVTVT